MVKMPFIMTSEPKLEKIKLTKANGKGRRLKNKRLRRSFAACPILCLLSTLCIHLDTSKQTYLNDSGEERSGDPTIRRGVRIGLHIMYVHQKQNKRSLIISQNKNKSVLKLDACGMSQ